MQPVEVELSRKPDALYKPEYYADRHNKGFE